MNRWLLTAAAGAGAWAAYRALTSPGIEFYRGKTVLITGGSRGLGLVLARKLVGAGANVAICARDAAELGRAYDDLAGRGGRVVAAPCDVTDRARVKEFVAVARRRLGPVDVLVNNASVIGVGPMDTMKAEDFDEALKVNFWAALYTCGEVVPEMRARGAGRVVNVSSFGGKLAIPHLLPYCVGKFALTGFSTGLRAEVAKDGVAVTTVIPGMTRTGSHVRANFKGRHEDEYAWFAAGTGIPVASMAAETAAARILAAAARGDAELILTPPVKLAVAAYGLAPNLTAAVVERVNRWVLPEPGGIGKARVQGHQSRGKLPDAVTTLSDRAAAANNETAAIGQPPLPRAAAR